MKNVHRRNARAPESAGELHLEHLLGRRVLARDNRPVGRIEEFRAEQRGDWYEIREYVIGVAGLVERLDLGLRVLIGSGRRGYVVRWDQLDISDPKCPRLTCGVDALSPI